MCTGALVGRPCCCFLESIRSSDRATFMAWAVRTDTSLLPGGTVCVCARRLGSEGYFLLVARLDAGAPLSAAAIDELGAGVAAGDGRQDPLAIAERPHLEPDRLGTTGVVQQHPVHVGVAAVGLQGVELVDLHAVDDRGGHSDDRPCLGARRSDGHNGHRQKAREACTTVKGHRSSFDRLSRKWYALRGRFISSRI
jgi:hypothetical protein